MKWFKMRSDGYRSDLIQKLMDELGHAGPCGYYFLIQLCIESAQDCDLKKMLKNEDHFFEFSKIFLQSSMRMKWKTIQKILDICEFIPVLKSEQNENKIRMKLLKPLEILEIDFKKPDISQQKTKKKPKTSTASDNNKEVWEVYKQHYLNRYKVEPVRNASVNSQIASLVQRLGKNDAKLVIGFYLKHNDSWYIKHTHSIGLCLKDAESLRTQMLRGRPITSADVKAFERQSEYEAQWKRMGESNDT